MVFVKQIQQADLSFIVTLPTLAMTDSSNIKLKNLNLKIEEYNNSVAELKNELEESQLSKTDQIIKIYHFWRKNNSFLLQILKQSTQLSYESNKQTRIALQELHYQTRLILKTSKHFNQWTTSIISKSSLQEKPTVISRKRPNTELKSLTYDDSIDYDNTSETDKDSVIQGKGISLPPRLQGEAADPKHRAWGTMYGPTRCALKPVYDKWQQGEKEDDLTVEIEFNDELREIDNSFNPKVTEKYWEGLNYDDKQRFNSHNNYFTKREALDYLVTLNNKSELCLGASSKPIDTKNKRYIFVMDMEGNLFINEDGQYKDGKRIGHPSFTRGKSVAVAGELIITAGKITYINNDSGHYQPGGYSLYRAVSALHQRGALAESCLIQVGKDNNFILQDEEEKSKTKLTLDEFSECYAANMDGKEAIEVNLSEKPNPLGLLNCLSEINHYLARRSKETSSIRGFFNSYSGADYYRRRDDFFEILNVINQETADIDSVIKYIDSHISRFKHGKRHDYADLLENLKAQLTNYKAYDTSVLDLQLVKKTTNSYSALYESMTKYTGATRNYKDNYHYISSNNESLAKIAEAKIDFKFLRKSMRPEVKAEFENDKSLHELEYKNVFSFGR